MSTETDDLFPEVPSYEELEEMHTDLGEYDDIGDWYNAAPQVAARLIVQAAREHDEFREVMLASDEFGVAHTMAEYDEERCEKLNSMGLSAFQGGTAENMARNVLEEDDAGA